MFVPGRINNLFVKSNSIRGVLPIGVSFHKGANKFVAGCKNGTGNRVNLGTFDTIEDAFRVYKKFKENVIKQVADEYKDKIPFSLYNALITYEVEITD